MPKIQTREKATLDWLVIAVTAAVSGSPTAIIVAPTCLWIFYPTWQFSTLD